MEKTKFTCGSLGLESKFIVLKSEEVLNVLDGREQKQLKGICDKLEKSKGTEREYMVVNCDETYAEEIAKIIRVNEGIQIIK